MSSSLIINGTSFVLEAGAGTGNVPWDIVTVPVEFEFRDLPLP